MSRLAHSVSLLLLWCLCAPLSLRAQDATATPAHISLVDGAAILERDGRSETAPASMPLLAGDRVRTQNGRVEILYADNSTLHMDANSLVDFQSDDVVRLLGGRVRLNIAGPNRQIGYRVDAPSAWVQIATPGEYRVSVLGGDREPEVELAVLRGAADLVNEDGRTSLRAGERAFARGGSGPSEAYVFNSAAWDAFDRWSEARRDARLGVSGEYLPDNVQSYASTFNEYGNWQYMSTYGYVWYPRVYAGWRPYYYGRWSVLGPWGWTWIGSDPWAWPTHHFGRWGFNAGSWFWIPGRTWGPAWVSWAYAPGYVSWCPLGWNNHAVFGFNANVFSGHRVGPWHGWTVVPHRGFGTGFVNVNVVNATRIDAGTRSAFVVRDTAPSVRGYAVPRASAPIRVAGTSRSSVETGTAVFRGSRGAASASGAQQGSDPAAAFRSRRATSAPLSGPGYPSPSREPRDVSSIAAPSRSAVSRSREAAPATGASPDSMSTTQRRAVPRSEGPTAPSAEVQTYPSRRAPSDYRTAPAPGNGGSMNSGSGYRAVPRDDPRDNQPSSAGSPPDRGAYRVPSAEPPNGGARAVPRSAPYGGGGPPEG
jgi:hypothetical protein